MAIFISIGRMVCCNLRMLLACLCTYVCVGYIRSAHVEPMGLWSRVSPIYNRPSRPISLQSAADCVSNWASVGLCERASLYGDGAQFERKLFELKHRCCMKLSRVIISQASFTIFAAHALCYKSLQWTFVAILFDVKAM